MIIYFNKKVFFDIFLLVFLFFLIAIKSLNACSNIFLDNQQYIIEARTLDFPIELLDSKNQAYSWYTKLPIYQTYIKKLLNHAFSYKKGYLNTTHISNIVIDSNSVPINQLAHWNNRYGYFGRKGFIGDNLLDGINSEGLSISAMFHPGSIYPKFNPNDPRPVLSVYDTSDFVLGSAKTTKEAINLLKQYQIVESALKAVPGIFIKDIPVHLSIRDVNGDSAVVEFINAQVVIHSIGNVITNAPSYQSQIQNAVHYRNLLGDNSQVSSFCPDNFNTLTIKNNSYSYIEKAKFSMLLALPEGTSSIERFIRANTLLNHLPPIKNNQEAIYQAKLIIDQLIVAEEVTSETLWVTLKDLKNKKIYYKDLYNYKSRTSIPEAVNHQYQIFDLNEMNFNSSHSFKKDIYHNERVKAIYSLYDIPGINSYFINDQFVLSD
ncbi:MAG: linear amide C-N hydrolase [Gammaproteobacteria bacterium]|nr:MAG: linear amide C-N hydrolase [Gammaproteobacteria bacterium]UTW43741.1 linear amide C-N hydrolase [bacterium SCSIO 12844]